MDDQSWNELVKFDVRVFMPGFKEENYSDLKDDGIFEFSPEENDEELLWGPDFREGALVKPYVQVISTTALSDHYLFSGFVDNVGAIGYEYIFGDGKETITPLWEIIKKELEISVEERSKSYRLPYKIRQDPASLPYEFAVVVLVLVWFSYDSYSQESDGGVEIIRGFNLQAIPHNEEDW